ncbi:hypothetical protein Tco_0532405 [Tanacetum coccineum]
MRCHVVIPVNSQDQKSAGVSKFLAFSWLLSFLRDGNGIDALGNGVNNRSNIGLRILITSLHLNNQEVGRLRCLPCISRGIAVLCHLSCDLVLHVSQTASWLWIYLSKSGFDTPYSRLNWFAYLHEDSRTGGNQEVGFDLRTSEVHVAVSGWNSFDKHDLPHKLHTLSTLLRGRQAGVWFLLS